MMSRPARRMRRAAAACRATIGIAALAMMTAAFAPLVLAATPSSGTTVKVESVRPRKDKYPTLRFLKENRDFIRANFDLRREKLVARSGDAGAIDPRYLAFSKMLAGIQTSTDSVAVAERARAGLALLTSITQLGQLESELDLMERLLADQRARLGILQADFTGRQQTELIVVMSGYPRGAPVSEVAVALEDGSRLTVALAPEQRELLRTGGVVQVFHGFVEPREQVLELRLAGEQWPAGDSGFVSLDPARDRLTMLRLHLSPVDARGASSIEASSWLHDERLGSREH